MRKGEREREEMKKELDEKGVGWRGLSSSGAVQMKREMSVEMRNPVQKGHEPRDGRQQR